jgi:hypothetical protein
MRSSQKGKNEISISDETQSRSVVGIRKIQRCNACHEKQIFVSRKNHKIRTDDLSACEFQRDKQGTIHAPMHQSDVNLVKEGDRPGPNRTNGRETFSANSVHYPIIRTVLEGEELPIPSILPRPIKLAPALTAPCASRGLSARRRPPFSAPGRASR